MKRVLPIGAGAAPDEAAAIHMTTTRHLLRRIYPSFPCLVAARTQGINAGSGHTADMTCVSTLKKFRYQIFNRAINTGMLLSNELVLKVFIHSMRAAQ